MSNENGSWNWFWNRKDPDAAASEPIIQENNPQEVPQEVSQESPQEASEEVTKALLQDGEDTRWYQQIWNKIPSLKNNNDEIDFINNSNLRNYTDLTDKQIELLRNETVVNINNGNLCANTWVWYKPYIVSDIKGNDELSSFSGFDNDTNGIVSMVNTVSSRIPIPFSTYPSSSNTNAIGNKIYIKNSLILPSNSPLDYLHGLPKSTKFADTFKNYYNFPHEHHLYLKGSSFNNNGAGLIKDNEKILIISIVGNLPDKYEQYSLETQRPSNYLTGKLVNSLIKKNKNCQIETLSFQSPLNLLDTTEALQQCITLLKNYEYVFKGVQSIYFVGIYHSIPLILVLATHILKRYQVLDFSKETNVGILAFESNIEGYRFWDHNTDLTSNTETIINRSANSNNHNEPADQDHKNNETSSISQDYNKIQQQREKQLFQYSTKKEQDVLQNIRNYRKFNSSESISLQKNLDWLLYNWKPFRLTLFGKLYDNFMTVSQKLAIDFIHPKIIRNIWCDGRYLDINCKYPEKVFKGDVNLKSLQFESKIDIPKQRLFEIELINNLLLLINLGYHDFIPFFKSISPFFISRSFNENTLPPTVTKRLNAEQKIWLIEMENKYKAIDPNAVASNDENDKKDAENTNPTLEGFPSSVSSLYKFLEFSHYEEIKSNGILKIFNTFYDDDEVYTCFIENTLLTKSPLFTKHLRLSNDHSTPQSIFKIMSQYDLVWKLHESLTDFISIKNLPQQQDITKKLRFFISVNAFDLFATHNLTKEENEKLFDKSNKESKSRVSNLWKTYQDWDPQTTGLKQLRSVMSVFLLYTDPQQLIEDLAKN